jgi:hypothetical protein
MRAGAGKSVGLDLCGLTSRALLIAWNTANIVLKMDYLIYCFNILWQNPAKYLIF